jgi:type II secretory ATPase GspE/PulE/Tfp pilus assembly ATPase PilB-like protein
MVGEIRDGETADIAIRAALTGHLVLSTLHTNDAPGALTRLIDMEIEPFLIASAVEMIIAQRLVRRLCQKCARPGNYSEALPPRVPAMPSTSSRPRAAERGSSNRSAARPVAGWATGDGSGFTRSSASTIPSMS